MTVAELAPALVAAVLVLWALGAHNRLVRLRNAIRAAWEQIDESLRRRHEALPALLAALREPLAAEHPTLDAVADALAQQRVATDALRATPVGAETAAFLRADGVLASSIARLLALLDQQPALRERDDVAAWLRELHDSDLRLAFARQAFNDAVDAYNAALAQFPTRLLRPLFGFVAGRRL
ncbi:MAG: LemA family protein [Burkholderiaceae bacterium]|jgi:LemA protein|nr:LemA family protein [Burkholderiaceae bacterium]